MIEMAIEFPFGDGYAYVTGTFVPFRAGKTNCRNDDACPDEPADFYIKSFIVGNVDIFDEIDRMYVRSVMGSEKVWYIDYITPSLIEIAEKQYNEEVQMRMLGADY